MDQHMDLEKKISEEATYIDSHYQFSFQEGRDSLERSVKYFMDSGSLPEQAWEQASELVAMALESAARCEFDLLGTVEHMLFARHHRVPSGYGF